jgi:hypothetical protein
VEAGDANLGIFSLIYGDTGCTYVAYYICMQNFSGRANEWDLKNTQWLITTIASSARMQW